MDLLHSQSNMAVNVSIRRRDKRTGKVLEARYAKNRVTKLALLGIVRFINGEFNQSAPDSMYEYIPRYLALGTNTPGSLNPGVTTNVTVNDAKLLDEITMDNGDSARIWIAGREHSKVESRASDPYVKLTINCYIQSNTFDGENICEAGLFTQKTGNNCWARVAFDRIMKTENDVLDITWEITVLSVGTTVYASSISVYESDYIQLGIDDTGYKINGDNIVDEDGTVKATIKQVNMATIQLDDVLDDSRILTDIITKSPDGPNGVIDYTTNGKDKLLSITRRQVNFENKYDDIFTDNLYYDPVYQYFCVQSTHESTNPEFETVIYDCSPVQLDSIKFTGTITYVTRAVKYSEHIFIYKPDESGMMGNVYDLDGIYTGWSIDTNNDFFNGGKQTSYHIGSDGIKILEGDRQKINVVIQPSSTTDTTVIWSSSNESIAKVNEYGVVEARDYAIDSDGNYEEVTITGITNNNLKVSCIVTVMPKGDIVQPNKIEFVGITDNSMSMTVGQRVKLETTIYPSNATNKHLSWTSSNTKTIIVDKDGYVEAISTGYAEVTCTTGNGISASCTITVSNS